VNQSQPIWLVTGAQGFLGANIGAFLNGRARRLGTSREIFASTHFDLQVAADLTSPGDVTTLVQEQRPHVIVHCAALAYHDQCEADPALAHAINVDASVALARLAQELGARFVFISTDAVFDGTRGGYREDDPVSPTSVYGRTKVEAEWAVAKETDALIVRTNFFGWSPTGRRSILEFFVNSLTDRQAVRGFTDMTTSSAYAQVLAQTIWQLVGGGHTGTFHVTSPDRVTKYDFGVAVASEFGLDASLITPTSADIHPPRNGDISLDVSKVQTALGISLPTMREGIALARTDADLRQALRGASGQ
jgi:dTDP-4-dehydrorhamnose reductase